MSLYIPSLPSDRLLPKFPFKSRMLAFQIDDFSFLSIVRGIGLKNILPSVGFLCPPLPMPRLPLDRLSEPGPAVPAIVLMKQRVESTTRHYMGPSWRTCDSVLLLQIRSHRFFHFYLSQSSQAAMMLRGLRAGNIPLDESQATSLKRFHPSRSLPPRSSPPKEHAEMPEPQVVAVSMPLLRHFPGLILGFTLSGSYRYSVSCVDRVLSRAAPFFEPVVKSPCFVCEPFLTEDRGGK